VLDWIHFRWLGTAGLEFSHLGQVLLIDPYLTRISFWQQWLSPLHSDRQLVRSILPRADFILITHAHYDHLLDVPEVLAYTGASVYGSANACALLTLQGVPDRQVHQVADGDNLDLGVYRVKVLLSIHTWIPFFGPGRLHHELRPPLRAWDYRMDVVYSYLIEVAGLRILVAAGEFASQVPEVEVAFTNPAYRYAADAHELRIANGGLVIPIHWDDFWIPLDKPVRPMFSAPGWFFPPLRRISLDRYRQKVRSAASGVKVLVPERLADYTLPEGSRIS
jgi:L-ascorbate metabolism protein UlaG (beta-lactamase superfamily)